jgi:type II restriction enzyme
MNLNFDCSLIKLYKSSSQIARILSEDWLKDNIYCPSCGNNYLNQFANNSPVADFLCDNCHSEYELKSKKDELTSKIVDGAYESMIKRINSENNPHFFFLNYSNKELAVKNLIVIPKHFFINDIIEKRKPLSIIAKRAGWIGCNILLNEIPSDGKIFIIKDGKIQTKELVMNVWAKTAFLSTQKKESRGWIIEIIKLVERINKQEFKLDEIYRFENYLKGKFPNNNFIKDKIRQQLQVLRDRGILEFKGNGLYRKI